MIFLLIKILAYDLLTTSTVLLKIGFTCAGAHSSPASQTQVRPCIFLINSHKMLMIFLAAIRVIIKVVYEAVNNNFSIILKN